MLNFNELYDKSNDLSLKRKGIIKYSSNSSVRFEFSNINDFKFICTINFNDISSSLCFEKMRFSMLGDGLAKRTAFGPTNLYPSAGAQPARWNCICWSSSSAALCALSRTRACSSRSLGARPAILVRSKWAFGRDGSKKLASMEMNLKPVERIFWSKEGG